MEYETDVAVFDSNSQYYYDIMMKVVLVSATCLTLNAFLVQSKLNFIQ